MKWLEYGDRNTAYFHNQAIIICKRNNIKGLMIGNEWNFVDEELQVYMRDFFMGLYTMDYPVRGSLHYKHMFLSLDATEFGSFLIEAFDEEIRKVIFSMAPFEGS